MSAIKTVTSILMVCVTFPIWVYLVYQIFLRIEATDLMWFLFWVYVPVSMLVAILKMVVDGSEKT